MEVEVKAEKFDETQSNTYAGQSLPAKKMQEAKSWLPFRIVRFLFLVDYRRCRLIQLNQSIIFSVISLIWRKVFRPKAVKYTPTELLIFLTTIKHLVVSKPKEY